MPQISPISWLLMVILFTMISFSIFTSFNPLLNLNPTQQTQKTNKIKFKW